MMASKKDEQRRIKSEKQAANARRTQWQGLLGRIAAIVLIPLVIGVLLHGFLTGQAALPPDAVGPADHVVGTPGAAVTLTVYADFQCPACAAEQQVIARAWPRLAERVQLVYRHYPLDTHAHAFLAARYAEAAGRQQRFWEFHDLLFANQALWVNEANPAPLFEGYAGELALNVEQLRSDSELPEVRDKVLADQRSGTRAGVLATPTLFLNGRQVPSPQSPAALLALVDEALSEQP
jgi:protein-disulfide isomerase